MFNNFRVKIIYSFVLCPSPLQVNYIYGWTDKKINNRHMDRQKCTEKDGQSHEQTDGQLDRLMEWKLSLKLVDCQSIKNIKR